MSVHRRTRILLLLGLLVVPLLAGTAAPAGAAGPTDRQVLLGYARDTWARWSR